MSVVVNGGETTTVPDLTLTKTDNALPQINALSADPIQVETGGTTTLQVEATDDDGDALSFSWSAAQGSLSATTGDTVEYTAPAAEGSFPVTVLVDDGKGGIASGTIAVLAVAPNIAPTIANLTPDDTPDVGKGDDVAVAATASDADGDALSFLFSATGGSLSGTGSSRTWTAPQQVGTFTITCVVEDGRGGTDQASIDVTVSETSIIVF